jgi:Ca-activated chloride channel family protein
MEWALSIGRGIGRVARAGVPTVPLRGLMAASAVVAVLAAAPAPPRQERRVPPDYAPLQSGIELVTLHVTVTDKSREYVTGLNPGDFAVFENGRRQDLAFFQRSGLPLAVALLFDTSGSMRGELPALQRAAAEFVRALDIEDVVSVMSFGDTLRMLQDFTADRSAVERAIRDAPAGGGTALNAAVYVALTELTTTRAASQDDGVPRRRVLVLLSDGNDTESLVGFDDVLALAARRDVAIYSIRLERPKPAVAVREPDQGRSALERLASQTGGRAFFPQQRYALRTVFRDIRRELASQYALAYEPRGPRDSRAFNSLSVLVSAPNAVARTRRGYIAGAR